MKLSLQLILLGHSSAEAAIDDLESCHCHEQAVGWFAKYVSMQPPHSIALGSAHQIAGEKSYYISIREPSHE
jgi:hypothetical protein